MYNMVLVLKSLFSLLLVNIIFISFSNAEINKDNFVIKAGLMKKINDEKYIVYKETTHIPYITEQMDPNFFFGYTLHSKSDIPFYHYAVLDVPSENNVSGDYININIKKKSEGRVVVTTKKVLNKYYGYNWSTLEKNDKIGLYKFKIYINDKLLTIIDFNVDNSKQENRDLQK